MVTTLPGSTYAGESPSKALVRANFYRRFKRLQRALAKDRPSGLFITLAGPGACEAIIFRDHFNLPPERVLLGDWDPAGLRALGQLWPEAATRGRLGPLADTINKLPPASVACIHLDFTGRLSTEVLRTIAALRGRLQPGATLAITYLRGREQLNQLSWRRLKKLAEIEGRRRQLEPTEDLNLIRRLGYYSALTHYLDLDPEQLPEVFMAPYQSTSYMGVLGVQYVLNDQRSPKWEQIQRRVVRDATRPPVSLQQPYELRAYVRRSVHAYGRVAGCALYGLTPETYDSWEHERVTKFVRERPVTTSLRFTPKPFQRPIIRQLVERFTLADRVLLVLPCGTGKTLVALWTAEQMGSRRTIIFAPTLHLLRQTLRKWLAQCSRSISALCVCSDRSVGRGDIDAEIMRRENIPVTEDPQVIHDFWHGHSQQHRVLLVTYASGETVARGLGGVAADLLVADEAHHVAGPDNKRAQIALDNQCIPAAHRLFMTATPRIRPPCLAETMHEQYISMDAPQLFGEEVPAAHALTFGAAIARGLLADYHANVVIIEDEEVREFVRQQRIVHPDDEIDARTAAQAAALKRALDSGRCHRVFTYHHLVRDAIKLVRALYHMMGETVEVNYVTGEKPVDEREEIIMEVFSKPRGVVCSAKALSEGVDFPLVDGIMFCDTKSSTEDIVQCLGRAMRLLAGQHKIAYVIIPAFLGEHDDPNSVLYSDEFKIMGRVLQALRAIDGRVDSHIAAINHETPLKVEIDAASGDTVVELLPEFSVTLPRNRRLSAVSLDRFVKCTKTRLIDALRDMDVVGQELLRQYARQYHTANVPQSVSFKGFPLGHWLRNVRHRVRAWEKAGRLSFELRKD
jgi:superfamily II DNA or RNA helicase